MNEIKKNLTEKKYQCRFQMNIDRFNALMICMCNPIAQSNKFFLNVSFDLKAVKNKNIFQNLSFHNLFLFFYSLLRT